MDNIVEQLRRFEGRFDLSDDVGSSDFLVCIRAADEIERLRAEVARCEASLLAWIEAVGECNKDRNRLRAECQRLAGEVSRAHKAALGWMERAAAVNAEIEAARQQGRIEGAAVGAEDLAAARREGIEMAMGAVEAEAQHWRDMKSHEAVMALVCGKMRIRALLEDGR